MKHAILTLFPLWAAACSSGPPPRPIYLERDVTRVLVLPPFMETLDPDAWKTLWPPVLEGVLSRGYRIVTREAVEAFYAKNQFRADPAEVKIYSVQDLAGQFQADAVFYTNITRWGYKYLGVYSDFGVEADFEMVDAKTGDRLWIAHGQAVDSRTVQGGNKFELLFSLVGVAGNAFSGDKPACSRRCVGSVIGGLPLAGRDPNPPPAVTIDGPAKSQEMAPK
jgi:hypothetical protein